MAKYCVKVGKKTKSCHRLKRAATKAASAARKHARKPVRIVTKKS